MTSAADTLEESWSVAVRLASARLTTTQRDAVSKAAKSVSQRINHRDQRHAANFYRAAFLSEAARVLNDPLFGLNLARTTEPREFGAVFYVMSAAETAIDALEDLLRYFRLTTTAMTLTLTKNERDVTLAASAPIEFAEVGTQIFEWGTAILVSALRHLTDDAVNPSVVSFTHHRSVGVEEFERFFGCPVHFGQQKDFMVLPGPLNMRTKSADPYLLTVLRTMCDNALATRGDVGVSVLRDRVEKAIVEALPHGKATAAHVAKGMALSTRTFTRRLADEGTTFTDILDQLRRALALHYLHDRKLEFNEIAWLLGYSEVSAFNHAFKRWTSTTPKAAREQLQAARQH